MYGSVGAGGIVGFTEGCRTILFSGIVLVFGAFLLVVSGICRAALMAEKESAFFFLSSHSRRAEVAHPLLKDETSAFT